MLASFFSRKFCILSLSLRLWCLSDWKSTKLSAEKLNQNLSRALYALFFSLVKRLRLSTQHKSRYWRCKRRERKRDDESHSDDDFEKKREGGGGWWRGKEENATSGKERRGEDWSGRAYELWSIMITLFSLICRRMTWVPDDEKSRNQHLSLSFSAWIQSDFDDTFSLRIHVFSLQHLMLFSLVFNLINHDQQQDGNRQRSCLMMMRDIEDGPDSHPPSSLSKKKTRPVLSILSSVTSSSSVCISRWCIYWTSLSKSVRQWGMYYDFADTVEWQGMKEMKAVSVDDKKSRQWQPSQESRKQMTSTPDWIRRTSIPVFFRPFTLL